MNTEPFTKAQIFSLIWMAVVVAYMFGGPRNYGPVPVQLAWLLVLMTLFSLLTLGKRFPMFGLFMLMVITSLMRGGGRRRRW
jgi:hypothetical protein